MNSNYKLKYLKYKLKYQKLKKLLGGGKEIKIYKFPDINNEFMTIDFDEGDDFTTIKNQILQKFKNPSINIDYLTLHGVTNTKCLPNNLMTIPENNKICFKVVQPVDASQYVPLIMKTGESSDSYYNSPYVTVNTEIPRPRIELLRPRIMQAVQEMEQTRQTVINYPSPMEISKTSIQLDLPDFSGLSSSSEASDISIPLNLPPLRLERQTRPALDEKRDLLNLVLNSEPYEIFDVRIDTSGKDYKLWLKDSNNNLLEVIITLQGRVSSIVNKGPINNLLSRY